MLHEISLVYGGTLAVAYVSEATPIPLATTYILLHHTIQDDGSPHTFNISLSPLRFLMKNLKFKLAKRNARLSMVQRMICGVIRLMAMGMLAPVEARGLGQGE